MTGCVAFFRQFIRIIHAAFLHTPKVISLLDTFMTFVGHCDGQRLSPEINSQIIENIIGTAP